MAGLIFSFGSFKLLPSERVLLDENSPVKLGGRAFDILTILVSRAGEIVAKDELIASVWRDVVVEEGALKVHIAGLRKTLGQSAGASRFVSNVPGRGYIFTAPVKREVNTGPAELLPTAFNLPSRQTRIIGRGKSVNAIVEAVASHRIVTLVGTGGIGKTTVAIAAAEQLAPRFENRTYFVDLSSLNDPALVARKVASSLGLDAPTRDMLPVLAGFLVDQRVLIVLDTCEHVIESAAIVAETIARQAPEIFILATSREPLRVEGELVHRLQPLDLPPVGLTGRTKDEMLSFAAIQLFSERAHASAEWFELIDANIEPVVNLCRTLDGVPLALELAAAMVNFLGVQGVAKQLDNRLLLETKGRRTAQPRHQSLRATLDWSYQLLSEQEQKLLNALSVFRSEFTLEAASAVAESTGNILQIISNLVAKSLVTVDVGDDTVRYRLLDVTRTYAQERLIEHGLPDVVSRQCAIHFQSYFFVVGQRLASGPTRTEKDLILRQIDNLRSSLDWCFSDRGDADVGVSLLIAALPALIHFALLDECGTYVDIALKNIKSDDARGKMHLLWGHAVIITLTTISSSSQEAIWREILHIAEQLDDDDYRTRALRGVMRCHFVEGNFEPMLELARHVTRLARKSSTSLNGLVYLGMANSLLGNLEEACEIFDRVILQCDPELHPFDVARIQNEVLSWALTWRARTMWMRGFADQAQADAEAGLREAISGDHYLSITLALVLGVCPIAMAVGDLETLERYVTSNFGQDGRAKITASVSIWARAFRGAVLVERGDTAEGILLLRRALGTAPFGTLTGIHQPMLCKLAKALSTTGDAGQALALLEPIIEKPQSGWDELFLPELLCASGEIHLSLNQLDAAEQLYQRALELSGRKKQLAWQLRAATGLARCCILRGRHDEGRALLSDVMSKFTEGFATLDWIAAESVAHQMSSS